jgi:chemotaxis methyl-accepting protein methylase
VEASDISHRALEATRTARYRRFASSAALPAAAAGYIKLAVGPRGEPVHEVAAALRLLVKPSWFNLVEPATYPAGPFDVIFCQNVLIYFGPDWRARVLDALLDRLAPGGYLAPAPGEAAGLKPVGGEPRSFGDALVFRRVS